MHLSLVNISQSVTDFSFTLLFHPTQREWNSRWKAYPEKVGIAFVKYHAVVIVMRIYERLASNVVDLITLDKLTRDTFKEAKRVSEKDNGRIGREMFTACMYANLIAFLADYTVHQAILCYTHYLAVRKIRDRKNVANADADGKKLAKRSALLLLSRAFGLTMASIGGAIGSLFLPGWGTVGGTNFGDGLATMIIEDIDV